MAALTDSDLNKIADYIRNDANSKAELAASGVSKSQCHAAIQALDSTFENARGTIKANMDAAAGVTLPVSLVKKLGRAWLQWKWRGE